VNTSERDTLRSPGVCIPPSEMSSWQIEAEPLAMTYSASPISLYLYLHHRFVLLVRIYHLLHGALKVECVLWG
jgi:hypothetical protein